MDSINQKIKRFVSTEINKNRKKHIVPEKKTPEELLQILKTLGGDNRLSESQYRRLRRPGDPNPLTYYRRFGSWNNACEMVWGKRKLTIDEIMAKEVNEEYVVRLINEYKVKTQEEYLEKREKYPDLFPSKKRIEKLFKNFTILFKAAEKFNIDQQLIKCLRVRLEMKKCPNLEDYRGRGINVDLLLKKYKTQKQINKMVRILEECYEKSGRDRSEIMEYDGQGIEREKKEAFKPFSDQLHSQF